MRAKFVNEHINFEKMKDPLSSLGVGKIHLITSWLYEMGVEDYTINDDFTIDVNSNVNLNNKGIDKFPSYIKFANINGSFLVRNNQLTSLKGCPNEVYDDFSCSDNQLINLEYCPTSVGGYFFCGNNNTLFSKNEIKILCNPKGVIYT